MPFFCVLVCAMQPHHAWNHALPNAAPYSMACKTCDSLIILSAKIVMVNMAENSQVQLYRDVRNVMVRLNMLEVDIRAALKKTAKKDARLEKGLKEVSEGKGRLYKTLQSWESDMKS